LVHGNALAGEPSEAKRAMVAEWLAEKKLDAAVITALDSVAWLLNLRGSDVERTPVALSFVLAHADGTAELFIAGEKVTPELRAHLGNAVRISPREGFTPALAALAGKRRGGGRSDRGTRSYRAAARHQEPGGAGRAQGGTGSGRCGHGAVPPLAFG
jgi:Xaa-Pro aminopeptidase